MSTTILTSLSTYMSKTSSMTTSKLKFVILKRLNKWKIKKKFRGGSCPGGKCTKVGGGRCHKNGGGKCPGGKCNTTETPLPQLGSCITAISTIITIITIITVIIVTVTITFVNEYNYHNHYYQCYGSEILEGIGSSPPPPLGEKEVQKCHRYQKAHGVSAKVGKCRDLESWNS